MATGSTYNCGIVFVNYLTEFISQELIRNRDKKKYEFIGALVASLARHIKDIKSGRILIIFLSPEEEFLIPYLSHIGFRVAGHINHEYIMSKYLTKPAKMMAGGVGITCREQKRKSDDLATISREIYYHSRSGYSYMWHCPADKVEKFLEEAREKEKSLKRELNEINNSVPPEHLGYWKRFREDNTKTMLRAWPS